MPNHILEYKLSTSENVDEVQVTNFTEKKKSRFSTLIWPLGIKWKFRNRIAHLQDMANHLQEYQLFFYLKCWWRSSDKTTLENIIFRPVFDPRVNALAHCATSSEMTIMNGWPVAQWCGTLKNPKAYCSMAMSADEQRSKYAALYRQ